MISEEAVEVLRKLSADEREQIRLDYQLKAERDERWRRNAAIKEGQVIGQVKLLQRFLGEAIAADDDLTTKSLQELIAMRDELQTRFDTRSKSEKNGPVAS